MPKYINNIKGDILVQCKCRLCGKEFERKIKPIQIKMFCGLKCSKSIEGLLLDFTEIVHIMSFFRTISIPLYLI